MADLKMHMSIINLKTPEEYGYVLKNNLCLFTKGPLSQWWGGFKGQDGGFDVSYIDLIDFVEVWDGEVHNWLLKSNAILGVDAPVRFNCCEQWMMACKAVIMNDLETLLAILEETSPEKQKALGRSVRNWKNEWYLPHRLNIVTVGNYHKFTQNEELKKWFISNFHAHTIFVEAAPWDKVWGIGLAATDPKAWDFNTWEGLNLLGEALSINMKRVNNDWER